jgi:hypothetical protein
VAATHIRRASSQRLPTNLDILHIQFFNQAYQHRQHQSTQQYTQASSSSYYNTMYPEESPQLLPGMHHVQGAESKTFSPIPLSKPCSLPEMIDFHMVHSSNHPVMLWNEGEDTRTITWTQFGRAIHRVARAIATKLGYDLDKQEKPPKNTFVAIMATGDQQTYHALGE